MVVGAGLRGVVVCVCVCEVCVLVFVQDFVIGSLFVLVSCSLFFELVGCFLYLVRCSLLLGVVFVFCPRTS